MYTRSLCSLLLLSAVACYSNKTVGVSKGDEPPPPPEFKPKVPTQILSQPGEVVNFLSPSVGDMDGDGFDDFVLWGQSLREDQDFNRTPKALYLFYGKPEFPAQISSADADAVFDVLHPTSGPVGDVNGDGLGDLILAREDSVEFVFGSKQRMAGLIEPNSAGPIWTAGDLPFAAGITAEMMVQPVGDVDGDGSADLLVGATGIVNPEPDGTGGGLITRSHLVPGHRGDWASGVWDPSWASATFGFDVVPRGDVQSHSLIYPERVGDLDGDGHADLLARVERGSLLFYGKSEFTGELSTADADARVFLSPSEQQGFEDIEPASYLAATGMGDLDGDGSYDLAVVDGADGSLSIIYGKRWSGETTLEPDLTILVPVPTVQHVEDLATGDVDGDGFPELLLSVASYGGESFDQASGIYVIRGTGKRLVGRRQLTGSYLWRTAPRSEMQEFADGTMFHVTLGGDVDGDGGQEILTTQEAPNSAGELEVSVFLVPSIPRAPD